MLTDTIRPSRRRFLATSAGALALGLAPLSLAKAAPATVIASPLRQDDPAFRVVKANGVHLVTQSFGDPSDPALVMLSGGNSSMLRYPVAFCERFVAEGYFVIRYDLRDTGRSVTYAPYDPPYTVEDLADDAIGVLDAYSLPRAHFFGMSLGGMIAQQIGLRHPHRALSLTAWSTTPDPNAIAIATTKGESAVGALPPPGPIIFELINLLSATDWNNEENAVASLVRETQMLAVGGAEHEIDVDAEAEMIRLEYRRAINIYSHRFNHAIMEGRTPYWRDRLSTISTPTLVIHGDLDAILPPAHGEALAREIPGSRFLRLKQGGHTLPSRSVLDGEFFPELFGFLKSI
jgi:pimeloyl-ACP methyl ester carboxylesterase